MDINRVAQVSTVLSAQQTASELNVAIFKLGNDQIKVEGQAALRLIESLPQPEGNAGHRQYHRLALLILKQAWGLKYLMLQLEPL